MELADFAKGFLLLRGAYGDRVFPKEREQPLWNRYKHCEAGDFKTAIDVIVLRMPQPAAILEWLDDRLGAGDKPTLADPVFACEACRDFGYGFLGDTVTACTCQAGVSMHPASVAKIQNKYNQGRRAFRAPMDSNFRDLPYDPKKREGA